MTFRKLSGNPGMKTGFQGTNHMIRGPELGIYPLHQPLEVCRNDREAGSLISRQWPMVLSVMPLNEVLIKTQKD